MIVQAQEGAAAPSFWNNAADRTNDIKAEFGALEDLFGAKKSTPLPKAEPGSSSPGPHPHHDDGKHKAPSAVTLLDFKRVQALCMQNIYNSFFIVFIILFVGLINIIFEAILLSRLKMSNEEIRAAILSFDAHKISQEDLKNLHKNAPTAEEVFLFYLFILFIIIIVFIICLFKCANKTQKIKLFHYYFIRLRC